MASTPLISSAIRFSTDKKFFSLQEKTNKGVTTVEIVEENKWFFAIGFLPKYYAFVSKICQKLFGCKSISQHNLECSLKYANHEIAKGESLKGISLKEEQEIISEIRKIESKEFFGDYLNSRKGLNDKLRLERLKTLISEKCNEKSPHLHISSDCENGIVSNLIIRENLLKEISINIASDEKLKGNAANNLQKTSLSDQLLKDIERSPLMEYSEEDGRLLNEADLPKDKEGNLLTQATLSSSYDEMTLENKMKVLVSCQRFYISIFAPLVRGYLKSDNSKLFVAVATNDTIKYKFEFNHPQQTNQIKISATDITFNIGDGKAIKQVILDEISFTITLKNDFEKKSFKDLRYDLIQKYTINSVIGLSELNCFK